VPIGATIDRRLVGRVADPKHEVLLVALGALPVLYLPVLFEYTGAAFKMFSRGATLDPKAVDEPYDGERWGVLLAYGLVFAWGESCAAIGALQVRLESIAIWVVALSGAMGLALGLGSFLESQLVRGVTQTRRRAASRFFVTVLLFSVPVWMGFQALLPEAGYRTLRVSLTIVSVLVVIVSVVALWLLAGRRLPLPATQQQGSDVGLEAPSEPKAGDRDALRQVRTSPTVGITTRTIKVTLTHTSKPIIERLPHSQN
jgi:hypothetical protein